MGADRAHANGVLGGEHAHALGAHGKGLVRGEIVGDRPHLGLQIVHGGEDELALVVVDVPAGAADGDHAVVHPVSGDSLKGVHGLLTVVPDLHEHAVVADDVAGNAQPEQVGVDALQLLDDHPDILPSFGHLGAHDVLHAHGIGQCVGMGADAAHPLHQNQRLDEVALLRQALNAPVIVAHKDLCIGDSLSVHRQTGVDRLLQCRMVGADGNGIAHNDLLGRSPCCARQRYHFIDRL